MSLLKRIDNKGCVLEWSPLASQPHLVALGTKDSAGAGFDDYGGDLEIHRLDFSHKNSSTILGSVKTPVRFTTLAWSEMALHSAVYPYGLIAGGLTDGQINIFDVSKLISGTGESSFATDPFVLHTGHVTALAFNPMKEYSHLLASGGADSEVYVTPLDRLSSGGETQTFIPGPPPNNPHHTSGITQVAWNYMNKSILASASQNGVIYIWDIKSSKAWCEIREPAGGLISDIKWSPIQDYYFVTASGDDRAPVIKVYDLRTSTTLPLATLRGHTEGVLNISWCPNDPSLLMSCGKDNKTILWDLFAHQGVFDLSSLEQDANVVSPTIQNDLFGSSANISAGLKAKYQTTWSPCLPAVIATCSFDRSVQFYSMSGVKSSIGRAPKWLRRPVGASFGFGGKLVIYDTNKTNVGSNNKATKIASILQVIEDTALVQSCDKFHYDIASGDMSSLCGAKASTASSLHDKQVWGILKVLFEKDARECLVKHLGFDSQAIALAADEFIKSKTPNSLVPPPMGSGVNDFDTPSTSDSLFSSVPTSLPPPPVQKLSTESSSVSSSEVSAALKKAKDAEPLVRRAIVVGNFSAAVHYCLDAELYTEALLFAQASQDSFLWATAQDLIFEKQKSKFPFLSILKAVITTQLLDYVLASDLSKWRETLAVLSTYGKQQEFPQLCETLAGRLENEIGDRQSANLCFMCAGNLTRAVAYWTVEMIEANNKVGGLDTKALQEYVEKVVVFNTITPGDLSAECLSFFSVYAGLLASQGRLDIASKYIKGASQEEAILLDRLYQAGNKPAGSRPPKFPFDKIQVNAVNPNASAAVSNVSNPSTKGMLGGNSQSLASSASLKAATSNQNVLPPGWTQYNDPASGRPYYVNNATGTSQWDPPVVLEAAKPVAAQSYQQPAAQSYQQPAAQSYQQPAAQSYQQSAAQSYQQPAAQSYQQPAAQSYQQPAAQSYQQPAAQSYQQPAAQSYQQPVAQSYQQPAAQSYQQPAAQSYQQPATQSYQQHSYPAVNSVHGGGFASVGGGPAISAPVQPAVVQQTVSQPTPQPVRVEVDSAPVTQLGQIIQEITQACQDKKVMGAVNASYEHLVAKVAENDVSSEVMGKIANFVNNLVTKNFNAANAVQMDLTNTEWTKHKDWIKGLKLLLKIAKDLG